MSIQLVNKLKQLKSLDLKQLKKRMSLLLRKVAQLVKKLKQPNPNKIYKNQRLDSMALTSSCGTLKRKVADGLNATSGKQMMVNTGLILRMVINQRNFLH